MEYGNCLWKVSFLICFFFFKFSLILTIFFLSFSCNETKGFSLTQTNQKTFDNENTLIGTSCSVNNDLTKIILIIASGVVLSLLIIYGILLSVRKMYKPLRPKVRKTYVVRRNITPLTCRPATEQQCEITIEDCCNMNICDTVRIFLDY